MTMALEEAAKGGNGKTIPPDPTSATTQMILREIGALKELTAAHMDAVHQRFIALDKALDLAHEDLVRGPTNLEREVNTITKLFDTKLSIRDERFIGIDKQFLDRDSQLRLGTSEKKSAIDSALQAAKDAVNKSELGFTKQIEQQGVMINTVKSELEKQIENLKERVTEMTANRMGGLEVRKESRESMGVMIGIVGAVVGFVAVFASMFLSR